MSSTALATKSDTLEDQFFKFVTSMHPSVAANRQGHDKLFKQITETEEGKDWLAAVLTPLEKIKLPGSGTFRADPASFKQSAYATAEFTGGLFYMSISVGTPAPLAASAD